jgi:type IV pilus assembly protein PilC
VITVAISIVGFIMVWIVPKFEKIFKEFELDLPAPTIALMAISSSLATKWPYILVSPIFFFIALKLTRKNAKGRYIIDRIKLSIPIFGIIIRKSAISRFARTLGVLLASGVPILEALNIVRDTTGNEVISQAVGRVHDSIREGESIAEPLKSSGVVDDMVVNMIDVGEETGEIDGMLIKVADTYDEDVDTMVASMMSILEPVLIVFLGGICGFIVISLFLPLVELIQGLSSSKKKPSGPRR